jgi:hypothetical protein
MDNKRAFYQVISVQCLQNGITKIIIPLPIFKVLVAMGYQNNNKCDLYKHSSV